MQNSNCSSWVVTADADSQHLPEDIWAIVEAGISSTEPIIGVRKFDTNVPFRSKLGNKVTQFLFYIIHKINVSDTHLDCVGSIKTKSHLYCLLLRSDTHLN